MTDKEKGIEVLKEIGRNQAINYRMLSISEAHDGTTRIANENKIPKFKIRDWGNEMVGCSVHADGHVWTLLQPYNGNSYPQNPSEMRAQWGLCHTKDPNKAKPYIEPLGTSGLYMTGECCLWTDGFVYKSKIDNNSWTPDGYPQ